MRLSEMKKQKQQKIMTQVKKDRGARRTVEIQSGTARYSPSVVHKTSKLDADERFNINLTVEEALEIAQELAEEEASRLNWILCGEFLDEEQDIQERLYDECY